jgi:hypothetical protein
MAPGSLFLALLLADAPSDIPSDIPWGLLPPPGYQLSVEAPPETAEASAEAGATPLSLPPPLRTRNPLSPLSSVPLPPAFPGINPPAVTLHPASRPGAFGREGSETHALGLVTGALLSGALAPAERAPGDEATAPAENPESGKTK